MALNLNPRIEIVKVNGVLRQCFVIDDDGERVAELPLKGIKEAGAAGEQGIVTLELHSIRVLHTDTDIIP